MLPAKTDSAEFVQLLRLCDGLPGVRLCHVIHDEILLEAPEALAPAAADLLREVMQDPGLQDRYVNYVRPLVADVKLGQAWAEKR